MNEHLNSGLLLFDRLLPSSIPLCILSNLSAARMKNKAPTFLKQAFSAIVAMVKAKSLAVKSKTSAMKSFGVLRHKKLLIMSAINHKIHALIMGQEKGDHESLGSPEDYSKAIVVYNAEKNEALPSFTLADSVNYELDDDDHPDLTHSLFEDEDDVDDGLGDTTGSVIDLVRNSKEEDGKEFSLEDEIDHVADVFIKRFHRRMRMQKLESFKRYQEMLERSA